MHYRSLQFFKLKKRGFKTNLDHKHDNISVLEITGNGYNFFNVKQISSR